MEAAVASFPPSFTSPRPAADALPPYYHPFPAPFLDAHIPSMSGSDYNNNNPNHKPPYNNQTTHDISSHDPNQERTPSRTPLPQHSSQTAQQHNNSNLTRRIGGTGNGSLSPLSSVTHGGQTVQKAPVFGALQNDWTPPGALTYPPNLINQGGLMQSSNYSRNVYSPNGTPYRRSPQPSETPDGLTTSSYSSGSASYSLPVPQQQHPHHSNAVSPSSHHQSLHNTIVNNSQTPGTRPLTPPTTTAAEHYMRPQSTSGYFPPPSSTPHHSTFSSFTTAHSSPTLASPSTLGSMSRGIGALSPQPHQSSIQAPPYPPRGYSYSTPIHHQMGGGSVLSNLSSPGSQVSLVGPGPMAPMGHGYPPSSLLSHHAMYHHPQQNPHQDRPFKCDVCTTAFNRNHDLKRHKKIHLAVKPFPCTFCDKSFSRKDALKRHRLVKGCGNGKTTPEGSHGQSPQDDIKRELGNRSDSYGTPGAIKAEPL